MKAVKNIIFDLGGVLLDIDFERSQKAFANLGIYNFKEMVTPFHGNELFNSLETGLDADAFYDEFRRLTSTQHSNTTIEEAWSALLVNFRKASIEQLLHLKERYHTFLLSNTKEIHVQRFQHMFRSSFEGKELDDCFEAAYYSNRIKIRKPAPEAWLYIMDKHALLPAETLFIDDGAANIEAAKQLGMQAIHLLPGMYIEELEW